MKRNRVWFEIVMFASTTALALALLFATLGVAAAAIMSRPSVQPAVAQQVLADVEPPSGGAE
jgi:hypothetical protein